MAVIGVIVRPENAVDPVDVVVEQLLPEVGRCIDEQPGSVIALKHNGNARTAIARFGRIAGAPVIANARNPGRGTRTEYDQFQDPALPNSRKKLAVV